MIADRRAATPGPRYREASAVPQPSQRTSGDPAASAALEGEVIAVVSLFLFSCAVAAGYARVFAGWQFMDDFVVMAAVGHGIGFLLRRLGVPVWAAVPALGAALVWLIGFVHYRDSYTLLLPTSESLELFRSEIELVRQQFQQAVAPVLFGNGWDVLAAVGMAIVILLSDIFAFRALARAESLVPGGVLFVFVAALGDDRMRVWLTVILVFTGVVATVALRAHHAPYRPASIGRRRSPAQLVIPAALGMATLVAATAGFVGPRLPGAGEEPIYETRGGRGGSVTEVVSPLVDIRQRLTNRSNSELFLVRADFESYWRSSALPRFDGTTWGLPERSLSSASGQLANSRDGADELRQEIEIVRLGGKFVPAAADPVAASPQESLRWNAESSTLLKTGDDLALGEVYEIVSASPRFDPAVLATATSTDAGDPIFLELPSNFPRVVQETAQQVTGGASSPYEAALALQQWFRSEFDYSLEVQAGHSTTAIEGFLRDRVGYCEQFAGTYAAMMRTLDIPARVAVGFTAGTLVDGRYSVLGKNAHAWPEVWFDGLGWVPFEPTPGRGAPGAEDYTDVPAQQDTSGIDPDLPVVPVPGDLTGTPGGANLPDGLDLSGANPTTTVDPANGTGGARENPTVPASAAPTDDGAQTPWRMLGLVGGLAALAAVPAVIRGVRRRLRRDDPSSRAINAWQRSVDAIREIGINPRASSTPLEQAEFTAVHFPTAGRPMRSLAQAVTSAAYAPDDDRSSIDAESCALWCRQVEHSVNEAISPVARVRRYFTRYR